uniref:Aspartic protease n=1 Tax=Cicer arietinum TaxID=3827 RepID=A0A0A7TZ31_CICAR|nr:aspartic protease [Cicer arietinum]
MDRVRGLILIIVSLFSIQLCCLVSSSNANMVFPVQRKFKGPHESLDAIKAHDARRHGRFLSAVDVPLGGNGLPSSTGLYYTKIGLGSPAKDFYVQVDTGSDILWVNCVGCTACPKKSGLGMDLTLYDPNDSNTSNVVSCDDDFCTSTYDGPISGCKQDMSCPYSITYGDGSTTSGSYVKDSLTFDRVNGNLHTVPENGSVVFGEDCLCTIVGRPVLYSAWLSFFVDSEDCLCTIVGRPVLYSAWLSFFVDSEDCLCTIVGRPVLYSAWLSFFVDSEDCLCTIVGRPVLYSAWLSFFVDRCGAKQSGTLSSSSEEALDGIIGFGQANSSVLSQLAASGKVKRIFSHCLDSINGGGIFSIGQVMQPKFNITPLVPRMAHYNVILKDMEVDGESIQLPTDLFGSGNGRGTIIDSGTTLAYLPASVYDQLVTRILARQPGLKLLLVEEQFTCFHYSDNFDEGFPTVKFYFEGLSLTVYAHDYLFLYKVSMNLNSSRFGNSPPAPGNLSSNDIYCIGWQKSNTQTKDGKDLILLGGKVEMKFQL